MTEWTKVEDGLPGIGNIVEIEIKFLGTDYPFDRIMARIILDTRKMTWETLPDSKFPNRRISPMDIAGWRTPPKEDV